MQNVTSLNPINLFTEEYPTKYLIKESKRLYWNSLTRLDKAENPIMPIRSHIKRIDLNALQKRLFVSDVSM